MPNACPQEQPEERKQSITGKKQQSVQPQRNTTGDTQNPKYVYFQACSVITYPLSKKNERAKNKCTFMYVTNTVIVHALTRCSWTLFKDKIFKKLKN